MAETPKTEYIPDINAALDSIQKVQPDVDLARQLQENVIPLDSQTPQQAREQRINFCLGMVSRNSGITRERIEEMIDRGEF